MQLRHFFMFFCCFISSAVFAGTENDDIILSYADSVEASLHYQYGEIDIKDGLAKLTVPPGYKFLDAAQSKTILHDVWGNPVDESTLGMLFPENISPLSDNFTYAVEVSYSEDGYIKDDDAKDLDYDELLTQMQQDVKDANAERIKQGYPSAELVGWAAKPFYDAENKKLHWAKEIKFSTDSLHTLNYNIRILGRKGYLNLNAIGTIDVLPMFQKDVKNILASVEFKQGNTYAEFDPDIDKVAAYGIGGLIAGKLLAKAGFFVVLLKFWKIIALGAAGLFAAFKKRLFGSKEEVALIPVSTESAEENTEEQN